jgi:hypothetical protein
MSENNGGANGQTPGVAELVARLSEQATRLARQEVELAKAELAVKGRRAGTGAALLAGAAILGLYGLGAITAAAIILIGRGVTPWIAAVIVGGGLALAAGGLAMAGAMALKRAVPPVPEQTVQSVRADLEYARAKAIEGRSAGSGR